MKKQEKIDELLAENCCLWMIVDELYGADYLEDEAFWNSPTEKQLRANTCALSNLNYNFEDAIKPEMLLDLIDIKDVWKEMLGGDQ